MNIYTGKFAGLDTTIHRWEPRAKFIGLMILIFSFSFINSLMLLPVMILISTLIFIASKLPFSFLLRRLSIPSFFVIAMGIFLIFFSKGTIMFKLGPLALKREGITAMILITVRFFCILTIIVTLFETTPFLTIIKVMNSLGIPSILTDMIMFTYRYIFLVIENLLNMQMAMRLRGFRNRNLKDIVCLSSLVGSLFIRSYEQSERIYYAMVLRGYEQSENIKEEYQFKKIDIVFTIAVVMIAVGMVSIQIYFNLGRV
ncbi:MAG: cobalt/nickel transport system permease protein [Candidatus Petromonas sp.]|jgi:cobalt/nickel transport system permease protein|nr:cobalt/nickel transport system permease protein [Candidatus Petromonas sp.]